MTGISQNTPKIKANGSEPKKALPNAALLLTAAYLFGVVVFYAVIGENSYIAIADNLDLFTPQYMILKNTGSFFSHGVDVPFLGGISRDNLPSEFNIVSVLYMLLPDCAAYVAMYVLKVIVAVISFYLLGKEILRRKYEAEQSTGRTGITVPISARVTSSQKNIIILTGLTYGIINFFPNFGIAFSSIPLILYLFLRLDAPTGRHAAALNTEIHSGLKRGHLGIYLAIFCYPFISYFSYFGIFILAYVLLAFIIMSLKRKKLQLHIFAGLIILALGYMAFEYRLFGVMLFGSEETIRSSIKFTGYSFSELPALFWQGLTQTSMHENDLRKYFVLPVTLIYFMAVNVKRIITGRAKEIFHDIYNLCWAAVFFNCFIYALFYVDSFKNLIFNLVPPLEGFQFDRTTFFNPFLLYACLGIICVRLVNIKAEDKTGTAEPIPKVDNLAYKVSNPSQEDQRSGASKNIIYGMRKIAACAFIIIAACVILATPTLYNDLRSTAAGTYRYLRTRARGDSMNYGEFYSKELFTRIKEDLGYDGEWSVAYGLYPAVLEYNGIATLDGYLGYYSQEYKESFRQVIAPALDRVEANRIYFDDWGARCYLAFGTDSSVQLSTKSLQGLTDTDIYIDSSALKELGCVYIFSRIKLTNADEAGLTLYRSYEDETQAYDMYVYTIR